MPDLTTPFQSTREALEAVERTAERAVRRAFTPLSFYRYEGQNDTWLLALSTESPGSHAKIAFMPLGESAPEDVSDEAGMIIGLYVDRGVDGAGAGVWNEFTAALETGAIEADLAKIETGGASPLAVLIDASTSTEDTEYVRFDCAGGALSLRRPASGLLQALNGAKALREVPGLLQQHTQPGEVAIDFVIGLVFSEGGIEVWHAEDIWAKLCAPLQSWLGVGS
jgi:hypothetical protein